MRDRTTLLERVRDLVDREPERPIFIFRDLAGAGDRETQLTYGGLWDRAAAFGEALAAGNRPDRVLLVLPLGTDLVAAHLGSLLAGGVPAIHSHPSEKIDPAVYARGLDHVLDSFEPSAVVTTEAFRCCFHDPQPPGRHLLLAEEVPPLALQEPSAWKEAQGTDIAVVQHSSGSTGLQKGVALSHEMISAQALAYAEAIQLSTADRICSWLPLYHDMGLFTSWLMPLLKGVPVAAIDPFAWVRSPISFLRLITEWRGTLCWQPNFAYNLLATRIREEDLGSLDLSSMRGFTNCSEPAKARSHLLFCDRFRKVGVREDALWVCYAMAENSFAVTATPTAQMASVLVCDPLELSRGVIAPVTNERQTQMVSCGRPITSCEVRVVDEERVDVGDRHVGEVAIRSLFSLRRYYRSPEATTASIDANGWFYTGDLGFMLEGQLFITGRKKDLLIVGGRNFYPQDIEAICDACPGAVPGRSVAIGVEDEALGTERVVVLVESLTQDPAVKAELSTIVRRRVLEELDCPVSEVHVVPHMWLLKTTSGKIARRPNLERVRRELEATTWPSPQTETPRQEGEPAEASWAESAAWAALIAAAIYIILLFQANTSWGVYAGF